MDSPDLGPGRRRRSQSFHRSLKRGGSFSNKTSQTHYLRKSSFASSDVMKTRQLCRRFTTQTDLMFPGKSDRVQPSQEPLVRRQS